MKVYGDMFRTRKIFFLGGGKVCRAHDILFRAHDILSRAYDIFSRANDI